MVGIPGLFIQTHHASFEPYLENWLASKKEPAYS
jgi:hypothetical protein